MRVFLDLKEGSNKGYIILVLGLTRNLNVTDPVTTLSEKMTQIGKSCSAQQP
jgi:hypothetical protein